jgi:uncharacterized membrane protein (Fun14 family)
LPFKKELEDTDISKRLVQNVRSVSQFKDERRGSRSSFTAKSVLLTGGLFIGALGVSTVGSGKGADASWLQSFAPGTLTVTGSYLAGFFFGWGARWAIKLTSIVTGLAVAAVGALAWLGWDATAIQSWLNSTSAWAGESIEGARQYLVSLLPSASAAGVGGVLGFKRK